MRGTECGLYQFTSLGDNIGPIKMIKNSISLFAIYDRTGTLITNGIVLSQAMTIKSTINCIIKFTGFKTLH